MMYDWSARALIFNPFMLSLNRKNEIDEKNKIEKKNVMKSKMSNFTFFIKEYNL